jgi:hypothetical protein
MRYVITSAWVASAVLAFAAFAHAGDTASFAWASTSQHNSAAAFAWATSCDCGSCANPDGLKWVTAARSDPNFGKTIYLVKPGKCNGTTCTKDSIIGGWSIEDAIYRPFDGKTWGKPAKPPIERPKLVAAEMR